jgi:hypothetical protein
VAVIQSDTALPRAPTRAALPGEMNEMRLRASIIIMKMKTRGGLGLAKGQVWKTPAAEVEIVALGKRFIHYRISPQVQPKLVSAQISGIEAMANYLQGNAARLIKGDSAN